MSKYRNRAIYPSISKWSAKRCNCCKRLFCKSTVKSNVNGIHLSLILIADQLMLVMFYLVKRNIVTCSLLVKLVAGPTVAQLEVFFSSDYL